MRHLLCCLILFQACSSEVFAGPVTIRILALNTLHRPAGPPLADLATQVKRLRTPYPSLFLVTGGTSPPGDDGWGHPSEYRDTTALMNALGVDALALGSQQLDSGQTIVRQLISEADFPVVAANLEGVPGVLPRVYFNRRGVRVAVIGLVGADSRQNANPRAIAGLTFISPLEAAREQIDEAELTADLIILLTQQDVDHAWMMAQALCGPPAPVTSVPILIVGQHTRTRPQRPARIGNCTVLQPQGQGTMLNVMDLALRNGALQTVNGQPPEDRSNDGRQAP